MTSANKIEEVLRGGFELVAFGRALLKDTDFINKLRDKQLSRSECDTSNYCIAVMYSSKAECYQNEKSLDPHILKMLR
jgi:2,4-dienoyl-CoA reductase-like NADH-dependent reductase (Old Yellow Enzyme family)